VIEVEVGEADLRHFGILQQIIRARGALKSRAEDEHSHQCNISVTGFVQPSY
jgi:hypothetical protein